jgi:hypothetical protein
MTCKHCGAVVTDPCDHCGGCGKFPGGWVEYAWLAATFLAPAAWLVGWVAILGMTN